MGYKRIEDKPGFLEIDEKESRIVQKAFDYFLRYETLSKTARELNKDGVIVPKYQQGGGHRLGFFTVDVLRRILHNKAYKGVKKYLDENGERKEAKAVWMPIIKTPKFDRVQDILKKNRYRKKPFKASRFPYLLTGLTICKTCGQIMCGTSAFGKYKTRYNYYTHGWASKKASTLTAENFKCNPHRVSAKKLEEVVLENVHCLASNHKFAAKIMEKARKIHAQDVNNKEIKRLQSKISGYNSGLEALVQRLAELPKNISASFIYKQMETLGDAKKQALERLQGLEGKRGPYSELPADFKDYQRFTAFISKVLKEQTESEKKAKILKRLIHRIEVETKSVIVHYYVGQDSIRMGENFPCPDFFMLKSSDTLTIGGA